MHTSLNPNRLRIRSGTLWGLCLASMGFASLASWFVSEYVSSRGSSSGSDFHSRFQGGSLLIVGGGETPPVINQRFWELSGGRSGKLVIIPAYRANPADVERLKGDWRGFRFASMQVLQADARATAEARGFSDPISRATAVWFSGGEQSWLASLYADTEIENRLQELLDRGGVIGGTSAGAAIMTRVMIEQGRKEPQLTRGLDLLKDAVIDQHFFRRNRMQRLARTLKRQPHLIGFGIDEATALVVHVQSGRLGVLGQSYVMACIPDVETDSLRLEVLQPGDDIDIASLREPEETAVAIDPDAPGISSPDAST